MFHLDHLCLGVRELDDGVRRVREETGLAHYDGGVFPFGLANTIFPLGGDVYLEVEAVTAPAAERGEGAAAWFDRAVADGDRWMFWSLRADSPEELAAVARRLGGEVTRTAGRVQPDGTQRVITTAPGTDGAIAGWRRGLPNWFYRDDPATHPDRGAVERGDRGAAVTRLEVSADAGELREHIGAETFERLPLVLVPGRPGVHAATVRTASGREVTLRRDPADL
ncbi:VOC family protein [Streptomyces tremellae]|uniref:Glyoxalase-like domain-containing protein n=1 Tax=Streptomyces tremellae TaxID=1124239 RepID=A0ABP7EE47_9ACTN